MYIYLFFKKYYIWMWKNIAIFLGNKSVTPNQASILSLFIIFPLFFAIYFFAINIILFFICIFFAINIKLILNAIDGIIAREKNIHSQLWLYLNVWNDIWPDILIIYFILLKIWADINIIYLLLWIVLLYLIFEFIFIFIYKKQNLFFWKDLRTFFYLIIWLFFYFNLNMIYLVFIYFIFFIIHNVWFFIKKYRS